MLNPVCFLVSLSSLFLSFILSRIPFFCLRLAVRGSVAPTVWRWSAAVAGVGAFAVRVCRGRVGCRLSSSAVAVRTGQLSLRVAVRLAPRLYGRAVGWSALRASPPSVGRSAFRSVDCRGGRAVRPAGGRSVAGRVVARRFGCAGRRESVARALRSASGGGRWSGWIGVGSGLSSPRFASFQLFDVNFLVVTH